MELNQKALDKVMVKYGNRYAGPIECYLESCNEPEPARQFDPALVKPGDEVVVNDGAHAPYKFVGMTSRGIVVCENCDGIVCERFPDQITISPKPKKTVKVVLLKSQKGNVFPFLASRLDDSILMRDCEPCSSIIEIEVAE